MRFCCIGSQKCFSIRVYRKCHLVVKGCVENEVFCIGCLGNAFFLYRGVRKLAKFHPQFYLRKLMAVNGNYFPLFLNIFRSCNKNAKNELNEDSGSENDHSEITVEDQFGTFLTSSSFL